MALGHNSLIRSFDVDKKGFMSCCMACDDCVD
ncbi:predicted protein [Sclerotinia sclerotiorum 1980 UF-70]|uniref:Uncharacterized protein n=1 Tax=Sclerotinia sclerotiorum (strain ATCC 18683 / 1980 / Ss-1) TaxID=665079 RepID=A7F4Z5_SCLS1|nr:predicted protein [Sclerotinia sclerotiorum 1980 UF-70]EDN97816.1 predicted protein [Sclerotinia sclerotiorum 1980 UF-70]